MNPQTHSEAKPGTPGWWGRLAWFPIPVLLAAIIAARMAGLSGSYESPTLLLVLSFTFYTLVSLGTLYIIGRSFLASGSLGLLLLECGLVFWSLAGTVGDFVSHGDANINVTIFNTGIMLAGICLLAGAVLTQTQVRVIRAKRLWLGAGCVLALGALWLVEQAVLLGWLPVFFIPGHGGTPVRYFVLISAIAMFVLSAGLLFVNQHAKRLPFTSWYALALLMLAVGLFGIMIQLSLGSVVNWLSRAAQWLGGVYLLVAALAALRESQVPLLPQENMSHPAYYRYAIAVVIVIAAVAIRLTFLSVLGTHAPYLLFFPAVLLAAIYGGLRPALLAAGLSALLADYFWIEPVGLLTKAQPSTILTMVVFLLSCAMIAWVTNSMHRALARASAAETQSLLAAEREAAMKVLQESESREKARAAELQAFLDAFPGIVFMAHDPECRNMTGSRATNEFLRLPEQSNLSKSAPDGEKPVTFRAMKKGVEIPPEELPVQQAARGSEVRDYEFDIVFTDGVVRTLLGNATPVPDEHGKPRGAIGVFVDITEREQAEAEREKLITGLETALKELDSFTYSVSHDLRAPLRAIDGFSMMLLTDIGDKLDPESMRKFNVIRDNTEKMTQLIDDLLRLSRTGRALLSQMRIEMHSLVEDVWEELLAGNRDRSMEMIINDLPPVSGDRVLLRQVLSNLLGNAIKFTSKRDHAVIEVSGSVSDGFNTYCIKDNGVGFDMRYYDKLFEIFRRLHSTKEYEGTGVGLAIVKKIVERHGGTIWAEGEPGEGATFCFTLPAGSGS